MKILIKNANSIPYCGMQLEKEIVNGGIFVSAPKFLSDLLINTIYMQQNDLASTPTSTKQIMHHY